MTDYRRNGTSYTRALGIRNPAFSASPDISAEPYVQYAVTADSLAAGYNLLVSKGVDESAAWEMLMSSHVRNSPQSAADAYLGFMGCRDIAPLDAAVLSKTPDTWGDCICQELSAHAFSSLQLFGLEREYAREMARSRDIWNKGISLNRILQAYMMNGYGIEDKRDAAALFSFASAYERPSLAADFYRLISVVSYYDPLSRMELPLPREFIFAVAASGDAIDNPYACTTAVREIAGCRAFAERLLSADRYPVWMEAAEVVSRSRSWYNPASFLWQTALEPIVPGREEQPALVQEATDIDEAARLRKALAAGLPVEDLEPRERMLLGLD